MKKKVLTLVVAVAIFFVAFPAIDIYDFDCEPLIPPTIMITPSSAGPGGGSPPPLDP
ncbi:MAG: hypothetical protein FWE11_05885 [Defluviitaleaceae bacterium]|nr:hypothetical protein [Defluviitaleaceae bacterium]